MTNKQFSPITMLIIFGAIILGALALPTLAVFSFGFLPFFYHYWWAILSIGAAYGYLTYLQLTFVDRLAARKKNIAYFLNEQKKTSFYAFITEGDMWTASWEHEFQRDIRKQRNSLRWAFGALTIGLLALITVSTNGFEGHKDNFNDLGLFGVFYGCLLLVGNSLSQFWASWRHWAQIDDEKERNWWKDQGDCWYVNGIITSKWSIPAEIKDKDGNLVPNPDWVAYQQHCDFLAEEKAKIAQRIEADEYLASIQTI
jgi:hypothetical protein